MTHPTPKELMGLAQCVVDADVRLDIVARALRSYAELVSALEWLCAEKNAMVTVTEAKSELDSSSCFQAPEALLEMARYLGWPGLEEL